MHIEVDLDQIEENARVVAGLAAGAGLRVTAVTKVFHGDPQVARVLMHDCVTSFADNHLRALARLRPLGLETWLLGPPAQSAASSVVQEASGSTNSDLLTLSVLNSCAGQQGRVHAVILMLDVGDGREGWTCDHQLEQVAKVVRDRMPNLRLAGIGTNFKCVSSANPTAVALGRLVELARRLQEMLDCSVDVSGGNSACMSLVKRGDLPPGVTHLRLGEALLFGRDRADHSQLPGTSDQVVSADLELVETRKKYGEWRGVVAVGKRQLEISDMRSQAPGVHVCGSSWDHLVLKLDGPRRVGEVLRFDLGYRATVRALNSWDADVSMSGHVTG